MGYILSRVIEKCTNFDTPAVSSLHLVFQLAVDASAESPYRDYCPKIGSLMMSFTDAKCKRGREK
jgi:hypothetical protein